MKAAAYIHSHKVFHIRIEMLVAVVDNDDEAVCDDVCANVLTKQVTFSFLVSNANG